MKTSEVIPKPADAYGQYWWKIIQALDSPDAATRDRAHFAIADQCRKNLHRFKKKPVPVRPGTVGSDEEILHAVLDMQAPKNKTQRKRMLAMFGSWRYAAWGVELQNQAGVETCINAIHTFRRLGIDDMAAEVEAFLEDEYDMKERVPDTIGEARELAARITKDWTTLSWELRNMERRPYSYDGPLDDDDEDWQSKDLPEIPR